VLYEIREELRQLNSKRTSKTESTMAAPHQNVYIVRYGLTKYPLVEYTGPYDSPLDPTEGLDHARAIANAIKDASTNIKASSNNAFVYCSPFLRTTETAHVIATALSCRVRVEEGLTEWQIPSLLVDEDGVLTRPKSAIELADLYDTIDTSYSSVNPTNGSVASPKFPETEQDLLERCKKTMHEILASHANDDSICIVSHAPCDQAIAYYLEGAESIETSQLRAWPLGGITKFTGLTMVMYGDTSHMPGMYKAGVKHWSLSLFESAQR
jgi:broad specificity phosphatase PhoE